MAQWKVSLGWFETTWLRFWHGNGKCWERRIEALKKPPRSIFIFTSPKFTCFCCQAQPDSRGNPFHLYPMLPSPPPISLSHEHHLLAWPRFKVFMCSEAGYAYVRFPSLPAGLSDHSSKTASDGSYVLISHIFYFFWIWRFTYSWTTANMGIIAANVNEKDLWKNEVFRTTSNCIYITS